MSDLVFPITQGIPIYDRFGHESALITSLAITILSVLEISNS